MFIFTFFLFTPLCLCQPPLFLSPFFCPPFALPYIVLAISQSTNGSYSSIIGGDPGPLGDRGWKLSECRKAFYLFLSLFSSVSLMFPFPRSVFLSLPLRPSLSLSPEIALKAGCVLNSPRRFAYSGLC